MPDPTRELETTLTQIADRWDAQRTERTLVRLHRTQRTRRTRRAALASALLAGVALAAWAGLRAPASVVTTPVGMQRRMDLPDGSQVVLFDAATQLRVTELAAARTTLELGAGRARFDVTHREGRVFRVECGEVTVEVLGTAFEIERAGSRTRVAVLRGRVAVHYRATRSELAAGEAGWFPKSVEPAQGSASEAASSAQGPSVQHEVPDAAAATPPVAKRSVRKNGPVPPAVRSWREPAEQGDFESAYELLAQSPQPSSDDVEALLLAADTARLSGHPQAALPYLKQVVSGHAHDSRAPLAAFTLGGVLMQQLGQPREAEAAYARARELSLNSSLAEDALARQVEAAHRAGDAARARTLASEYLARYPRGRRVHAVQRFGGLVSK